MLFNSIDFVVFYLVMLVLFYASRPAMRWALLLVGSYFFYMYWEPLYLIIILFSTMVDYLVGLRIAKYPQSKKWLLAASLTVNLGILFAFKYVNFFSESLSVLLGWVGIEYAPLETNFLLPVGISYYTFQTISYTVDVYRDRIKPEPHLGKFALFVSFFPQLVAGPIERARNLLPQFQNIRQKLNYNDFAAGMSQMLWGFVKKTVIADTIAIYVDAIYEKSEVHSPTTLFFASVLFFVQLYCDFSGYTDIALGSARTLGFRLMRNFNIPLLSYSVTDFWRRWHISLYRWILDYIYAPLRGNDRSTFNRRKNLLIVFLVIGLWHGASLNFVFFGLFTGFIVIFENMLGMDTLRSKNTLVKLFRVLYLLTWGGLALIFFRSQTTEQGLQIFSTIFSLEAWQDPALNTLSLGIFLQIIFSIVLLFGIEHFYFKKYDFDFLVKRCPTYLLALLFALAIMVIVILGVKDNSAFIYFQF